MRKSIAWQQANNMDFIESVGSNQSDFDNVTMTISGRVLAQYGIDFAQVLQRLINSKKLVASGQLADNIIPEVATDGTSMRVRVIDYFDYPNKGVKGVFSSKNAPNSPYQYKTLGMSEAGRKSIEEYVRSGRAKIETVQNDKAKGIGLESKGVDLMEAKVNQLIYLIKAYGIKATNYFDEAVDQVFQDFEIKMAEAVGKDLVFTINKLGKK